MYFMLLVVMTAEIAIQESLQHQQKDRKNQMDGTIMATFETVSVVGRIA